MHALIGACIGRHKWCLLVRMGFGTTGIWIPGRARVRMETMMEIGVLKMRLLY